MVGARRVAAPRAETSRLSMKRRRGRAEVRLVLCQCVWRVRRVVRGLGAGVEGVWWWGGVMGIVWIIAVGWWWEMFARRRVIGLLFGG